METETVISKDKYIKYLLGLIWFVCIVSTLFYILKFLYVSISRIDYPFALEWMEGASLAQVQRVLLGKPLYVQPSIYYIPMIYPPLYFYLSAFFAKIAGLNFFSLRLVSLISSLGTMLVVGRIVYLQTKNLLSIILAVGLFAGTFYLSGGWFDIARVDMLAIFLFLISLDLVCFKKPLYFLFSGISAALACLTKQTFIIMVLFLSVGLILNAPKISKYFFLSFVVASFFSFLFFVKLFGEWYAFYVFALPGRHVLFQGVDIFFILLKSFALDSIIYAFPMPVFFVMLYYFILLHKKTLHFNNFPIFLKAPELFWFIIIIGSLFVSWSGFFNPGGYKNVLLPFYTLLCVFSGFGLHKILSLMKKKLYINMLVLVSLVFQYYLLDYSAANEIPTQEDLVAGFTLVNNLRNQKGNVFIPFHPELALMAGKPVFASWVALYELEGGYTGGDKDEWERVRLQIVQHIKNKKFDLIILDRELWGHPEKYYSPCKLQLENTNAFYPVTGFRTRPISCFVE